MYFHEVATGQTWQQTRQEQEGAKRSIHREYPSIPARRQDWGRLEGTAKVAVVRGPVERLISCYHNKVESQEFLDEPRVKFKLRLHRLATEPTFEEFVDQLDKYRKVSVLIRKHTQLLSFWLGEDASIYERIFHIRDLDALERWMATKGVSGPEIAVTNTSGRTFGRKHLSPDVRAKIRARFKKDFALYGPWLRRKKESNLAG